MSEQWRRLFIFVLAFMLGWIMRQSAITFGWGYTAALSIGMALWALMLFLIDRRQQRRERP